MPVLKNQRHELFCQELAKGKTATDAYATAGYAPSRNNAAALKSRHNIIARVMELQGNRADRVILNKQYVVEALLENAEKALGRKPVRIGFSGGKGKHALREVYVYEGAVANAAIRMAGLELSMFTERRDVKITNEYAHLTDEQLAQKLVEVGQLMLSGPVIEHEEDES